MMRILFLGTGPFAVPSLRAIHESEHELLGLVTRPAPTTLRRRQKPPPNPMREAAEELGLEIKDPADINSTEGCEILAAFQSDLLVVCDYGQILSSEALERAPLGGINLHGSLLPKYRGAAPVHWAIYRGDKVSGVSVIHMTPRLDGGPILVQLETAIGDSETMPELEERLAAMGTTAVMDSISQLANWDGESEIGQKQQADLVTKAPRLKKEQGNIDWSQSAEQIRNQIRAFQPWPGSFTWWARENSAPLRIVIERASVAQTETINVAPGTIVVSESGQLVIATGVGGLALERLQPSGKKMMEVGEFLRGYAPRAGQCFGPQPAEQ